MQVFYKYKLIFLLIMHCSLHSIAQESDLYFESIVYNENFARSEVSSMVQSRTGFIWIGTESGLMRYDGYNFLRYARNENEDGSISNNHVNVILEDNTENLWVGTNNGLNLFNRNTNDFTAIDVLPIKGGRNYISSIIEDSNENLWVGTFGGVKLINKDSKHLEDVSSKGDSGLFTESRVLSLFYDKSEGVLVGTSKGLFSFDPISRKEMELPEPLRSNSDLMHSKVQKIVKAPNGDLWFATEANGVFWYSEDQDALFNFVQNGKPNSLASNWVSDVLLYDDNTVWLATNDGLSLFKKDQRQFINHKHNALLKFSVTDNDIKCFLKDRSGSIWLGTVGGGINFYNQSNVNFVNIGETVAPHFGLNNGIVKSVIEDLDGSIWVGTYGGGLNHLEFDTMQSNDYAVESPNHKKSDNMISALALKGKDNLLCGTRNGLYEFNKKSKVFRLISPLEKYLLKDERPITSLEIDGEEIWIGTDGKGLIHLDKNMGVAHYTSTGNQGAISDNFIVDIDNHRDKLWIATQDGLNLFDKNSKSVIQTYRNVPTNEENDFSLSNNTITELFRDSQDRLWIGVDYGGLNYFDEDSQKFYLLNSEVGFTDGSIQSISEDINGNLWVSADNMLFEIKILNFTIPFSSSNFEITSYSVNDGLAISQFSNHCGLRLKNGHMVVGGSNGLAVFQPEKILKAPNENTVVLTKLMINNEEVSAGVEGSPLSRCISKTSEISLSHDQGYLGIEFSALNFINPKSNRYAYRLDNLSKDDVWHDLGNQNSVMLSSLQPGIYDFKVRTSNEASIWNSNVKSLKIEILPPWWRTNAAYFIYLLMLMIVIGLIFRFVKMRIALKRALFLEQFENERQQELYKMKLDFFTNVSHELRTPLTLISGPVEELLEESQGNVNLGQKLEIIKRNSDRLLKLVNELLDFRKAEKGRMRIYCEKQNIVPFCFEIYESFKGISVEKNIDYKFVINSNSTELYFDKNQLEKVIYNLLSNAFKFTKRNGKIVVSVEQRNKDAGWVDIKVKDNGIGIAEKNKKNIFKSFFQADNRNIENAGSGVGLALSKSIVELHKGEISMPVETETWATTVFQISLRKGARHLKKSQIINNQITLVDEPIEQEEVKESAIINDDTILSLENKEEGKRTILFVDDNEEIRTYIVSILSKEYKILEFTNGHDAINHMEKEIPDLVISDVMMPEMDGFELCRLVKTNEATNHIPVILLTAKSSTSNRITGLSTGADSYLTKPFSIKVLKLNIINLLSAKEIFRQKYSGRFIVDSDLEKLSTPEEIFINKLMEIIETNIENPDFDVNELVREIGMSRTVLYKKVQTLTNHSVASLIKHIRLKKAADILCKTNYSISEITYMVGFNDRKHFSREFKKVYKLSPSSYKNAQEPVGD